MNSPIGQKGSADFFREDVGPTTGRFTISEYPLTEQGQVGVANFKRDLKQKEWMRQWKTINMNNQ